MAVTLMPQGCTLRIVVQTGVNALGQPVYKNRDYKGVKPSATQEDLYAVASAMAGLSTEPVAKIERLDVGILENA